MIICLLVTGNLTQAQTKFEIESRIAKESIPEIAKNFVYKLTASKKIKWYKENNLVSESIEAKTFYKDKKYSIEFNTNGTLQGVEIETKLKTINTEVKSRLTEQLKANFKKYKIKKIQTQYSGNTSNLLSYFKTDKRQKVTIKYEIILKGKTDDGTHLYELLFSENGSIEKTRQIVFRNTDNIEF